MNLALFRILADADPCKMSPIDCDPNNPDPNVKDIIGTIIETLFLVLAVVSVFVIIYAGFTMMTSAGDPGKVQKGKKTLTGAVIGLIISVIAYGLVKWVVDSIS